MRRFTNSQLEYLDPKKYFAVYSGGKPMEIASFAWDAVGNRYILYTTEGMGDQFIQAIYHIPDPPFWLDSNPTLANISQGNSPSLGGPF